MIIMSQDDERFVIIGKGTSIVIDEEIIKPEIEIAAYYGDQDSRMQLGIYKSIEAAKRVLDDIYDSIGEEGKGKYKMPPANEIEAEVTRKKRMEEDRKARSQAMRSDSDLHRMLSVRTANALINAGYYTVRNLVHTPEKELETVRNLGKRGLEELRGKGLTEESAMKASQELLDRIRPE